MCTYCPPWYAEDLVALLEVTDLDVLGQDSKMPIVDVAVTPATAMAGVTPMVTSRPARTLNPTKPNEGADHRRLWSARQMSSGQT